MKHKIFSALVILLMLSTTIFAQQASTNNIIAQGIVVTVDTTSFKVFENLKGPSVVFVSKDGDKYYLLFDNVKKAQQQKLIRKPGQSIKISGKCVDKDGEHYVIVERFLYL